jgi:hypothetical protein
MKSRRRRGESGKCSYISEVDFTLDSEDSSRRNGAFHSLTLRDFPACLNETAMSADTS